MHFLSPALLWALAALAVPILLHLFYFRRFRKVAFSNVRFLNEVKEETQNRSRLRNLLVLALRLLAFAAIVLAFAQPLWRDEAADVSEVTRVSLFVDNSYSMSAQASDVALLEKAKQRAREVVGAYGEGVEFQVYDNSLSGASSRWLSQEDAYAALDRVSLSAQSSPLATVRDRLARSSAAVPEESRAIAFLISDFQRSQFSVDDLLADTTVALNLVPISPLVERNVSIDSVWLASPVQLAGEPTVLLARLTNHGDTDAEAVRLSARVNQLQQPFGTRNVPARASIVDTLRLTSSQAGWTDALVSVTDFPIEFDDDYFVSFQVRAGLKALAIGDAATVDYLQAAFPRGGGFQLDQQAAGNVNYSNLPNYDLVILADLDQLSSGLSQSLTEYTQSGGKLLVFPGVDANLQAYNQLLASLNAGSLAAFAKTADVVGRVNTNSFVFSDVFERLPSNLRLPRTEGRFGLRTSFGESLLTYRDGQPYITAQTSGTGVVYVVAAPLDPDYSDLVRNGEIFVPMLYRMALSGPAAQPIGRTLGESAVSTYVLPEAVGEAALRLVGTNEEAIPAQRRLGRRVLLSFNESPTQPGFYRLQTPQDSTLAHVAFNYDRRESEQDFIAASELAETGLPIFDGDAGGSFEASLTAETSGRAWWPYLVGLALLALLAESLVLRFWQPKRAALTNVRASSPKRAASMAS